MEADLSAAALLAVVLVLGMKLPAEHLLAAPSSFLYFLTLPMAFMAEAEAAKRSFFALVTKPGSSTARLSISVSRMCTSELSHPPTLSTDTAESSELTLLAVVSTLSIKLYTRVSFLSILLFAKAFIFSFLACLMTK